MCGICFICSLACPASDQKCAFLHLGDVSAKSFISHRGPDVHNTVPCTLWSKVQSLFAGFVLHLRGDLTPQPLRSDDGDILLWNGEIFGGIEVGADENDTQVLFNQLVRCDGDEEILSTLQSIQGPWALIFWQAKQERLWFGRDVFGRRSLLWHLPQGNDGVFTLSSVQIKPLDFEEIPSVGMFCLESSQLSLSKADNLHSDFSPTSTGDQHVCTHLTLHLYPWQGVTWPGTDADVASDSTETVAEKLHLNQNDYISVLMHNDQTVHSWMPSLNTTIPDEGDLLDTVDCRAEDGNLLQALREIERKGKLRVLVTQLMGVLQKAVVKRVHNLPRLHHPSDHGDHNHCLASGAGQSVTTSVCDTLDSVSLQTHLVRNSGLLTSDVNSISKSSYAENGDVTFQESPQAGRSGIVSCTQQDSTKISPSDQTNNSISISGSENSTSCSVPLSEAAPLRNNLDNVGVCTRPTHVAILFSGGIDSTVLAALADRCLPADESIDLINVAFEQKMPAPQPSKKKKGSESPADSTMSKQGSSSYNVPDRLTGYSALAELNPRRHWNFVEVNVTQEMLQEQRSQRVRHLVYPLKTVLDDSIGCAVWFAAMGKGVLGNGPNRGAKYTSTARVILCGMGADEQLAGYSRHRVRFQKESWAGLIQEVNMEIHRISARNLGRDDRIITDHGKESRFPFLDEDVVAFLAALPIQHKADLRLPRGVGEKLLLRLLALELSLPTTAALPKRAIQFGSRIAKLEQSKEKGAHVCQRLTQE